MYRELLGLVIGIILIFIFIKLYFKQPALIACNANATNPCPNGMPCFNGYCSTCKDDTQCPVGTYCWQGQCVRCGGCYTDGIPANCPKDGAAVCGTNNYCKYDESGQITRCTQCPAKASDLGSGYTCPVACPSCIDDGPKYTNVE